ncbi:MAG TPA: hypothetical protein VF213_12000, partial [Dongiaceae bacterium]
MADALANGDAHALNAALASGQISYQQYSDAMGMGAPAAAPPPPPPQASPYIEHGPDQSWANAYGPQAPGGPPPSLADATAQAQGDAEDLAAHQAFMNKVYGTGTARGGAPPEKPKAKPLAPDALTTASKPGATEAQGSGAGTAFNVGGGGGGMVKASETARIDPKRIATIDEAQKGEI